MVLWWLLVGDSRANALGNGFVVWDVRERESHGVVGAYSCGVYLVVPEEDPRQIPAGFVMVEVACGASRTFGEAVELTAASVFEEW